MWYLPTGHRKEFREPFGSLHKELSEILPSIEGKFLCSVGDIVTNTLFFQNIVPDIAIIDGFTQRLPVNNEFITSSRLVKVKNPAGTITRELLDAIIGGIKTPPVLISVDGEEDLAVVPLVIYAKEGTIVLYGQPGEGVVMRVVDAYAKKRAGELFSLFRESV